ncbi:MAG: glycosyltransferase [Hyphomicrobiaceae bacterium]|nr:glycosyltransferase [Hyphomicrobiaceae bacterium]
MSTDRITGARRSRLAIISSSASLLERNCRHIVRAAQTRANAVLCLAPGLPIGVAGSGPLEGASMVNLPTEPRDPDGLGKAARSAAQTAFDDWRPDTVLACGLDALAFSHAIARKSRLSHISLLQYGEPVLPPLGFYDRLTMRHEWHAALKACRAVIVADRSIATAMRDDIKLAPSDASVRIVSGAGVDLAAVAAAPLPGIGDGFRIMAFAEPYDLVAPQIWQAIAAHMAERGHAVSVELVCPAARRLVDPQAVDETEITRMVATLDVLPEAIARAHVCVALFGAQTFTDSLQTALALGRPVLALDTPAHRRAVDERVNGILLKSAEPEHIIQGIETMLRRPDLFASMARASRAKAERMFDATVLSAAVLDALELR